MTLAKNMNEVCDALKEVKRNTSRKYYQEKCLTYFVNLGTVLKQLTHGRKGINTPGDSCLNAGFHL